MRARNRDGPGEYESAEVATSPEFAVADAIVELAAVPLGQREHRFLHIRKLRGSGFLAGQRSEEHTSELQSRLHLVCRLLLEQKNVNRSRLSLRSVSFPRQPAHLVGPGCPDPPRSRRPPLIARAWQLSGGPVA